jgi:hypothetical protein
MRRYLVVAHQTLGSPELLVAMRDRLAEGPCTFHLLVPEYHGGPGLTWTVGKVRAEAIQHLEGPPAFIAEGLAVTGEVGDVDPVDAVADILRREGRNSFDGVIVSTLPHAISQRLRVDAPSRIQRNTGLAVFHVVGHPVEA